MSECHPELSISVKIIGNCEACVNRHEPLMGLELWSVFAVTGSTGLILEFAQVLRELDTYRTRRSVMSPVVQSGRRVNNRSNLYLADNGLIRLLREKKIGSSRVVSTEISLLELKIAGRHTKTCSF